MLNLNTDFVTELNSHLKYQVILESCRSISHFTCFAMIKLQHHKARKFFNQKIYSQEMAVVFNPASR